MTRRRGAYRTTLGLRSETSEDSGAEPDVANRGQPGDSVLAAFRTAAYLWGKRCSKDSSGRLSPFRGTALVSPRTMKRLLGTSSERARSGSHDYCSSGVRSSASSARDDRAPLPRFVLWEVTRPSTTLFCPNV